MVDSLYKMGTSAGTETQATKMGTSAGTDWDTGNQDGHLSRYGDTGNLGIGVVTKCV